MEVINIAVAVLFFHFIADFALQSRWMGENKSGSLIPLFAHIGTYAASMFLLLYVCFLPYDFGEGYKIFQFVFVNAVLHLFVDFWTSKATKFFYQTKRMHAFWTMIGFDQFLHTACILLTIDILFMRI